MVDVFREVFDGGSFGGVCEHYGGASEGGVADFVDAVGRDVGDEADVDGVLDVDVVGEAAGEVEAGVVGGGCADGFEDDVLTAVVGGFGLGECGDVGAGDGQTVFGVESVFVGAVVEVAELVHDVVSSQLGQQVDQAGAADADGVGVADGG